MIRDLMAVGIGGAAGSIARYLLSYVALSGGLLWGFPIGTPIVNALGSLLIGVIIGTTDSAFYTRLLAVGFCGGFTTFSTFSTETVQLLRQAHYLPAILYIGISLGVCLLMVVAGMWIGQLLKN